MSSKELIMDAVSKAYIGLPVEYHKRLGERLVSCVANWCEDVVLEDLLCDIKYHGEQVKAIYRENG